jgi:hypothetical protein
MLDRRIIRVRLGVSGVRRDYDTMAVQDMLYHVCMRRERFTAA